MKKLFILLFVVGILSSCGIIRRIVSEDQDLNVLDDFKTIELEQNWAYSDFENNITSAQFPILTNDFEVLMKL